MKNSRYTNPFMKNSSIFYAFKSNLRYVCLGTFAKSSVRKF